MRETFSPSRVTRALKAAAAGGIVVSEVEVRPDGTIVLKAAGTEIPAPADSYEAWRKGRGSRAQGPA